MRSPLLLLSTLVLVAPVGEGNAQTLSDTSTVTVRVEGISGERARNVLSRLSISRISPGARLSGGQVRRLHARAEGEIRAALEPFGLYRPEIESDLTSAPSGGWVARYRVTPGPPVRIQSVDIQLLGPGGEDPALLAVSEELNLRSGAPFRHPTYESAKAILQNSATARGYLDATFTRSRVEVDLERYEARVFLHLQTGIRYRFGEVSFPDFAVREEVLHRYVPFEGGAPFQLQDLLLFQRQLSGSDYFASVSVEPQRDRARGDLVPIAVGFRPRDRVGYGLGIGYGTDTGLRGTFGGRIRWLNRSGHRLLGELRGSLVKNTVSARYLIPLPFGPEDDVSFTAGFQDERFEGNWSTALHLSGGFSHRRGGWKETFSLDAQEEKFRTGGERGQSTLLFPTLAWSRARGDDPLYPSEGSRVLVRVRGAAENLLSDVSFLQASARIKIIRSREPWGRIIGRVDVGTTTAAGFDNLPLSFRFFAGGDQSIRGFPFHSVGPKGGDGSPTGGRHLITTTLEWNHRVVGPVGIAVFTDAGNVYREFSSDWSLEKGIGVGGRWQSPFGPLRVDFAWAITHPGNPFRVHFAFGGEL